MMSSVRSRFPFSARQWEELEQQALVYKYMACGMPIPPDLLFTIRTSLHSSLISSSKFLLHQPQHIGWSGFEMGYGRKIDPEPGRCRRTDGKKWRCSKEAYPDSKYCERHMHRGRNRSRKPVEIISSPINNNNNNTSINKNTSAAPSEFHFLNYPNNNFSNSTRPPPQENPTKFFLDNSNINAYSHSEGKHYRNNNRDGGIKGETRDQEHGFNFSEGNPNSGWQMAPLTMGSSQIKDHKPYNISSGNLETLTSQQNHSNYYNFDNNINERDNHDHHPPKKVMHHFLDEWTPKDHHKDSWPNNISDQDHHKLSSQKSTQLSMSIPNSMHDFFITQK